jgi:hypothetical protein
MIDWMLVARAGLVLLGLIVEVGIAFANGGVQL